ncbi:hypothetical protein FB45DRAFT_838539 [Roridomyces roridus]|uniref:CxC2-like cysteine cluster KDZ transposase-associated domain-containing protein n=1 Tax=Roridomyces roridus TaxID=1738132 RepID=A0AAD7FIL0_9AGAR|nr:hypothetical protein FB45DRAFT_838539 [Roridomyces roridus]
MKPGPGLVGLSGSSPALNITKDDPLRQWTQHSRDDFLDLLLELEGRGVHHSRSVCPACYLEPSAYCCDSCTSGGELLCKGCIVKEHGKSPLHVIKFWNGKFFETKTLKDLGLRIQLGHWASREDRCFLPDRAAGDSFVIIGEGRVHSVALDFCGCGKGGLQTTQLMRAGLYPATVVDPRTAATFAELDRFELLNYESKCSAWDYY